MKNREIAEELNRIADILEFKKVQWKPRAYRAAARQIENLGDDIAEIYEEKGRKGLEELSGIGKSIAEHIADYLEKGKVKKWEKLKKEVPEGTHEMIQISGLGANKIKDLVDNLGIKNISDLKKAIKQKKLRKLEGFGKKTEENILDSIKQYEKSHERMLLKKAMPIAEEIIDYLKKNAELKKINYAGSLRRMKETIGDIDILVETNEPEKLMDVFVNMPSVKRVVAKGKTKSTVILKEGVHVDVRVIAAQSYGAAMQYFTGSKDHNIALRNIAVKRGYKLSEYGLFKKKSGKKVAGSKEEEIYKKLGVDFIPPEMRENRGEIELAKEKKIPRLIELKDVKGDLQMHTKYSDGKNTVKEMIEKAEKKGYKYIAITDHSKSQRIAQGMSVKEIKKQWEEVDKAAKNQKAKVLKGVEVDILPDGSLDYSDKILKQLDIVLVSIHSRFKSSQKQMTERIVKALKNKHVNIFSHPTGRMIGRRQGYNADFEKVFEVAADNKVALEINSDPERLDLNDAMILEARKHKVKFSFGTDAHAKASLDFIKFGVGTARRGWLEKKDVINTYTYKELKKFLKK